MRSRLMPKNVSRPTAGLALSLALLSGCASAEGREFARGLLEGVAEASSTMAAMKGGKYAQYAQYAPIAQATAQMFEVVEDLPHFQEEPEVHLGDMPGAITAVSGDPYSGGRYQSTGTWDVQGIVNRLAGASGLQPYPVRIVADQPENAFADGAAITVTQGLLRAAASEDELALVLGHEIAHNVLQHPQSRPDHHLLADIAQDIAKGHKGIGTNTKLAIYGVAEAIKGAHTRPQEAEADRLGTQIAFKAGYDPIRGTTFFQRAMAQNAEAWRHIANIKDNAALWERYLANARNARVRAEGYQARARSWMEQARINRDRSGAIHARSRTAQSYNQAVYFENRYKQQYGVYQQAWARYERAAQNEANAQANHKAFRHSLDSAAKQYLFSLVPFVQSHPMDSERIRNVVALTQQLRSGDSRLASAPMNIPSGGSGARAPSAVMNGTAAGGHRAPHVPSLGSMPPKHSIPSAEALAVALVETDIARDSDFRSGGEAEARPEQEAVPVLARLGTSSLQTRAVVEETLSPASTKQVFIRGLKTSQELSFSETGSVNVWSISGSIVNPTSRPVKQTKVRAIFYDEAGEEVHRDEKSVSFPPGVAEAPFSWNVKGVALRAQRVEVAVVGADNLDREGPKTAKKAKRSA